MTKYQGTSPWQPGDHIVIRHVSFGKVWAAFPVTIVEDSPACVCVYIAPGARFIGPACTRDEYLQALAQRTWKYRSGIWNDHQMLWIWVPGETCSIWKIWRGPNWCDLGWKINPERPWVRTSIGFDTADHILDVLVEPNISSWKWKDEEELDEAIGLELLTQERAIEIRQGAEQVLMRFLAGRPDVQAWAAWRPPSNWDVPKLGPDWNSTEEIIDWGVF